METADRPVRRSRVWPAATVLLTVLLLMLLTAGTDYPAAAAVAGGVVAAGMLAVLTLALVTARQQRRAYEDDLTAWAAERAAHAERLRIARDLHDLASHGLGLIKVRAAAARTVTGPAGNAERAAALADIERAGREATTELRRMLAVLRGPGDETPLRPTETLTDLPRIVEAARVSGVTATLDVDRVGEVSGGDAACRVRDRARGARQRRPARRPRHGQGHRTPRERRGRRHGHRRRARGRLGAAAGSRGGAGRPAGAGGGAGRHPAHRARRARVPPHRTATRDPRPGGTPMAAPVRVLVVDDQPLIRHSLRLIIDGAPELAVVGEADTGAAAVDRARALRPGIVLMDIRMPGGDGIDATRRVTADPGLAGTRVLVLRMFELDEYVHGALRAGASGFLLKDARPEQLVDAIRRTHSGESLFAPGILTRLVEHYLDRAAPRAATTPETLTVRETEVLTLVGRGLSNQEIGAALTISMGTVKTHIGNLLAKLHARDRAQLVIAAYEHGLVTPGRAAAAGGHGAHPTGRA